MTPDTVFTTQSSMTIDNRKLTALEKQGVIDVFYHIMTTNAINTILGAANGPVWRFCCRICGLSDHGTKMTMYKDLCAWVRILCICFNLDLCLLCCVRAQRDANVPKLPESDEWEARQQKKNSRQVLGKEVMSAVHADMEKTELPSWITRAPYDWGTTRRGKLSADHWKTICSVHLPITLIRLFGHESSSDETRKRDLLDNFMDLVIAVRIASLRHTTPDLIQQYDRHVHRYLTQFKTLFKDQTLKPNLHSLMHIGDYMEWMGPNHARNASPFEREINVMQDQNTNLKFGNYDGAIVHTI